MYNLNRVYYISYIRFLVQQFTFVTELLSDSKQNG